MYNHKILIRLGFAFLVAGCSPSARAMRALEEGNHCEFCAISAGAAGHEPNSMHNLGVCFENGWCGYTKDKDLAIVQYKQGARWGIPQSVAALRNFGVVPPGPDLKIAQDAADAKLEAAVAVALGAALLVAASSMNTSSSGYTTSYQGQTKPPTNFIDDYQGCCSWHGGINRDILGKHQCHFSGYVLCKDLQPSPTCRCVQNILGY